MRVHHSTASYTSSLFQSKSNTDSDDSTPFALPDDKSGQKTMATAVSATSTASSISSGFWLNQSGASSDTTTDDSGSSDSTAADDADTDASLTTDTSAADLLSEFAKWANMTPAEKIRADYLQQQNLTEEQFQQLPPDEQKAINDKIAEQIKQQLGLDKAPGDDKDKDAASALSIG